MSRRRWWGSSPTEHEVLRNETRDVAPRLALIRDAQESVNGRSRHVVDPAEIEALRQFCAHEHLRYKFRCYRRRL